MEIGRRIRKYAALNISAPIPTAVQTVTFTRSNNRLLVFTHPNSAHKSVSIFECFLNS